MNERFGKEYKLCSQKIIETIFETKQGIKSYPFIIHFKNISLPAKVPFQLVISVPKRSFKKAHDRNKIKRQIKEIFRKNKAALEEILAKSEQQFAFFLIFTAREALEFELLTKKLIQLIDKLTLELSTKN